MVAPAWLAATPAFTASVSYTYDALGRVVAATYSTGATVTYTYDSADNRTRVLTQGGMAAAAFSTQFATAPAAGSSKTTAATGEPGRTSSASAGERAAKAVAGLN